MEADGKAVSGPMDFGPCRVFNDDVGKEMIAEDKIRLPQKNFGFWAFTLTMKEMHKNLIITMNHNGPSQINTFLSALQRSILLSRYACTWCRTHNKIEELQNGEKEYWKNIVD